MFVPALKRFTIVVFICSIALFTNAQQIHFIYLQTESGQPFYVKLNNKVVSSSSAGYLILPKLADGDYKLSIGFPKKEFPEEDFHISINKKDEGFLLKNFGEKGWGLFNMQSYEVVMGGSLNTIDTVSKNLQSDPFSKMLANVVKDSSILQKNEPIKEDVVLPKADSTVAVVAKTDSTLLLPPTRLLSKKNEDGVEMMYADHNQNENDTVRIFIPVEKAIIKTGTVNNNIAQIEKPSEPVIKDSVSVNDLKQEPKINIDTTASIVPLVIENKAQPENKDTNFIKKNEEVKQPEIVQQDSKMKGDQKTGDTTKENIVVLPKVVKSSSVNSDCKAFAIDDDFLRLRKKMASENSNDNMIKIAKKAFHSKCFSTEQIKNLSFLFLTNEGKYMFFDAAYAFVSDSDQYQTLQSQLTDDYYINRFKAMIHK